MRSIKQGLVRSLFLALALAFMAGVALSGCHDPGPAEEAGREVDEAMEDASDALDDLGDDAEDATDEFREDD